MDKEANKRVAEMEEALNKSTVYTLEDYDKGEHL